MSGSMSGTPECSRTKCRPFGVMMPLSLMQRRADGAEALRIARIDVHAAAYDVLFEPRRRAVGRKPDRGRNAHPRLDRQPLRRLGKVARRIAGQRQRRAAGEEQAAMQEPVAGNDLLVVQQVL